MNVKGTALMSDNRAYHLVQFLTMGCIIYMKVVLEQGGDGSSDFQAGVCNLTEVMYFFIFSIEEI